MIYDLSWGHPTTSKGFTLVAPSGGVSANGRQGARSTCAISSTRAERFGTGCTDGMSDLRGDELFSSKL